VAESFLIIAALFVVWCAVGFLFSPRWSTLWEWAKRNEEQKK